MPQRIRELVAGPRFQTLLIVIFSGLALAMAAVGVYGVAAWAVTQRTREIGIRMALGATPADVRRLVMGNTFVPIGAGVLVGIAGALAAGRYLESQLFEVKTNDPVSFVAGASLLAAIALLATYIPARRAARANPAATLRCE